jgi:TRAP-type uncharacterized transport system fused permease subunit
VSAPPPQPSPEIGDGIAVVRAEDRGLGRIAMIAGTLAAVLLAIHQLFNLQFLGIVLIEGLYLYLLAGIFLGLCFLCFRVGSARPKQVPWYDWALALAAFTCAGYFAFTADESLESGWEYAPPEVARWVSLVFYLLILEGTRRAGGMTLFIIVFLFSIYPTFADKMPDPLSGYASPFMDVVPYHMISS